MNMSSLVAARLIDSTGEVWREEDGMSIPLTAGANLQPGQLLHTGNHGTALLQLASGHELGLGPDQYLLLDADVLADATADSSEWALGARANPAMVAEWLAPAGSSLEFAAVIEVPGESLDQLLQSSAPISADSTRMPQSLLAEMGDDGLSCLLRSLYGPDSG